MAMAAVQRWPRNPKQHKHDAIAGSVEQFGFIQPLLVDERVGRLVAGHGRLETLQQMRVAGKPPPARIRVRESDGEWLVPVLRGISFKDDAQAEAYLLADNRLSEIGGWDDAELGRMLTDTSNAGVDAATIGWSDAEFLKVLEGSSADLASIDAAAAKLQPGASQVGTVLDAGASSHHAPSYLESSIKKFEFYVPQAEYDRVLAQLNSARVAASAAGVGEAPSNSDVIRWLLRQYDAKA